MSVKFIHRDVVEVLHRIQNDPFGTNYGARDKGALDLALAHPVNKAAYGEDDIVVLAAAYLFD